MSAIGGRRTSRKPPRMSAYDPKRTSALILEHAAIEAHRWNGRKEMKKAKKEMKKLKKKEKGSSTKVDRQDAPPTSPFSS